MSEVVPLRPPLYRAGRFEAVGGIFAASGTLCGHLDFITPRGNVGPLTPDEVLEIVIMLQRARADVLNGSNPHGDPRLYDKDLRDPDYTRPSIFATHNCWKCKDGSDLSKCPTPDRPGNCGYPHARND